MIKPNRFYIHLEAVLGWCQNKRGLHYDGDLVKDNFRHGSGGEEWDEEGNFAGTAAERRCHWGMLALRLGASWGWPLMEKLEAVIFARSVSLICLWHSPRKSCPYVSVLFGNLPAVQDRLFPQPGDSLLCSSQPGWWLSIGSDRSCYPAHRMGTVLEKGQTRPEELGQSNKSWLY